MFLFFLRSRPTGTLCILDPRCGNLIPEVLGYTEAHLVPYEPSPRLLGVPVHTLGVGVGPHSIKHQSFDGDPVKTMSYDRASKRSDFYKIIRHMMYAKHLRKARRHCRLMYSSTV